jgi:hypothetical protein
MKRREASNVTYSFLSLFLLLIDEKKEERVK